MAEQNYIIPRNTDKVMSLLAGVQRDDPRLYNILKLLTKDLEQTIQVVEPIVVQQAKFSTERATPPALPAAFSGDNTKDNVRLFWSIPDGGAAAYEIREGGTGWDDANYITNSVATIVYLAPETTGSHTYKLKTISSFGVYSNDYLSTTVVVTAPEAPIVTANVIDNNVLLYWNEPNSTYWVDFYEVWKTINSNRIKIGEVSGLFTAIFEQAGGDYLYEIIAFDIAGNQGVSGFVSASVANPPDFASVESTQLDFSTATLTAAVYDSNIPALVVPINLTEGYETHFTTPPPGYGGGDAQWSSPDEQRLDGFELWIQDNPTGTAAAICEFSEIDYGPSAAYEDVLTSVTYVKTNLTSPYSPDVRVFVRTKPNGGSWTAYTEGANQYLAGPIRYIQVKFQIDNTYPDSMCAISNAYASIDVKREVDSGEMACVAGHTNGTPVYVDGLHDPSLGHSRKAFSQVDSITLSTQSLLEPITLIYDDAHVMDATNPYFSIYAYDSGGIRISKNVSWKIRGIVN